MTTRIKVMIMIDFNNIKLLTPYWVIVRSAPDGLQIIFFDNIKQMISYVQDMVVDYGEQGRFWTPVAQSIPDRELTQMEVDNNE